MEATMGKMNLAEIMDRSVDLLRKYIKTVVMYAIGYSIFSFIIVLVIALGGILLFALTAFAPESYILPIIIFSVFGLFIFAFSMSYHIGIIRIAAQEYLGERVYAHNAIGTAFKSVFRVFGIVAAAFVLFIPLAAIFAAAAYFLYNAYGTWWSSLSFFYEGGLLTIVLIIAFVITAILAIIAYLTWYAFSLHAVTIEKKGVFSAIKRSWQLVRQHYWKIFGCILLFILTIYAVNSSFYSFLGVILGIIYLVMKFLNVQQDYFIFFTMAFSYGRWPINILSWLVISPIGSIMLSLLYFSRRSEREGFDMLLTLREIQKNDENMKAGEALDYPGTPQA